MTATELIVENVSFKTKNKKLILRNTSFSIKTGILGVVGPNGAGKSTLLRLLYRYYKPTTGNVLINGTDIWHMSTKSVACKVAVVLQEQPSDYSLTVHEIISLGRIPHRGRAISLTKYDSYIIDNIITKLGINKLLTEPLNKLSGGEKQIVMIARALIQEPKILILDELTNHLDIRHQLEILKLIKELNIIIIASLHDLNIALNYADNLLILANGSSIAFGSPQKILTKEHIATAFNVVASKDILHSSGNPYLTFNI